MGWPNNDPEGWAEVERDAVGVWIRAEITQFGGPHYTVDDVIEWLQTEHNKIFQVLLDALPGSALGDAEADYLERKFSIGGEL